MIDDIMISEAWVPGAVDKGKMNSIPFRAYPNPSNGHIRITIGDGNNSMNAYDLNVYNMLGMIVHQDRISDRQSIDLGDLPKGQYLLHLSDGEGKAGTDKIIIQ